MAQLTVDDLHAIYPDAVIRQAFLARDDIRELPPEAQDARWQAHQVRLQAFLAVVAHLEVLVVRMA